MWPGGSVANWGSGINADTAVPGLNPCNATNNYNNTGLSDAAYLKSKGVVVASFELKMDVLMAMQINSSDIDRLFDSISNASTSSQHDVISAVVFRAGFRSEAVYIRSEDAYLSNGIGRVQSLALSAAFSEGQLTYLLWDDVTCNSCGGLASQRCITTTTSQPQHSCAATDEACLTEDCSLSVYMGFTGDDRNGVVFQTGTQIHRINQYAVSSLYNSIVQQVSNVLKNAQQGFVGDLPVADSGSGDAAK
ncbi:g4317 [Coccomyxa elongata]